MERMEVIMELVELLPLGVVAVVVDGAPSVADILVELAPQE
jgi:hypothetical protein